MSTPSITISLDFNEHHGHYETRVLEIDGNKHILRLDDRTRTDAESALLLASKYARRIIRAHKDPKTVPALRKRGRQ